MRFFNYLGWCLAILAFMACKDVQEKDRQDKVTKVNNQRFFAAMKPYLSEGYAVKMIPSGISMLPVIQDNADLVFLRSDQQVKTSDIVLVEIEKGHYVMHRVVGVDGSKLTLKGDNNKTTEKAELANVLAKVVCIDTGGAMRHGHNMVGQPDTTATYHKVTSFRLDTKGNATIMVDTINHVVDMQHVITFNETARFVWEQIKDLDAFTIPQMVQIITSAYDVSKSTAMKDCIGLLQEWLEMGLVEKVIRP